MSTMPSEDLEVLLSDEQIAHWREHGFTWVDRLTTDAEVAWLRDRFVEVFDPSNKGHGPGSYFDASSDMTKGIDDEPDLPQAIMPELKWPELLGTIAYRNSMRIGAQLLDIPVDGLVSWTHMIDKPPRRGHETPWHQDEAFWEPNLGYQAAAVWIALDDVDEENGCMRFQPDSHLHGIRDHTHMYDDPMVSALVVESAAVDEAITVPVPLKAGGATFHTQRTIHSTGPNVSDRRRRAYAIEVQVPPYELAPEQHKSLPWKTL